MSKLNSVQKVNFKKEILRRLFIQVLPARLWQQYIRCLRIPSQPPKYWPSRKHLYEQTSKDFLFEVNLLHAI